MADRSGEGLPVMRGLRFIDRGTSVHGQTELLNHLCPGQEAIVLQLPAQPAAAEAEAQKRVACLRP
jgi:hypothetical protein